MRIDVLTLFPEMFSGYLGQSLLKRAIDAGFRSSRSTTSAIGRRASISRSTIGRSAAGRAWCCGRSRWSKVSKPCKRQGDEPGHLILFTPQGRRLDQQNRRGIGRQRSAGVDLRPIRGR